MALQWFEDYFRNRTQTVRLGSTLSDSKFVTYGVPQGTVLAPLLFLIYVNSLFNLPISGKIISFADDTAIVWTGGTWEDVYGLASREMEIVKRHLDSILLSLNVNKTDSMAFSTSRLPDPARHSLFIHTCLDRQNCGCLPVNLSSKVKYLGIFLDSKLKWYHQITHLNKRLRKTIFLFKELSHLLDRRIVMQAYYSLCQSLLTYGNLGWGGTHKTLLDQLMKTQKLILKIIFHRPHLYSSTLLFRESGVLDIRQLYIKHSLIHFQTHRQQALHRQHDHNTRNQSLNLHPRMNTSFGQRHYKFLAPKFHNDLPEEIRTLNSPSKFKKAVHRWIQDLGNEGSEHLLTIQR